MRSFVDFVSPPPEISLLLSANAIRTLFCEALVFVFFVPCTKKQNPTSCECSKVKRMVVGLGTARVRVHIFASCKCCNCLKRLNETNYEP